MFCLLIRFHILPSGYGYGVPWYIVCLSVSQEESSVEAGSDKGNAERRTKKGRTGDETPSGKTPRQLCMCKFNRLPPPLPFSLHNIQPPSSSSFYYNSSSSFIHRVSAKSFLPKFSFLSFPLLHYLEQEREVRTGEMSNRVPTTGTGALGNGTICVYKAVYKVQDLYSQRNLLGTSGLPAYTVFKSTRIYVCFPYQIRYKSSRHLPAFLCLFFATTNGLGCTFV
jgi:hypothetical protein